MRYVIKSERAMYLFLILVLTGFAAVVSFSVLGQVTTETNDDVCGIDMQVSEIEIIRESGNVFSVQSAWLLDECDKTVTVIAKVGDETGVQQIDMETGAITDL